MEFSTNNFALATSEDGKTEVKVDLSLDQLKKMLEQMPEETIKQLVPSLTNQDREIERGCERWVSDNILERIDEDICVDLENEAKDFVKSGKLNAEDILSENSENYLISLRMTRTYFKSYEIPCWDAEVVDNIASSIVDNSDVDDGSWDYNDDDIIYDIE